MAEWAVQEGAHDGRICVLLLHGEHLYSSGVDGVIRMWSKDTMELIAQVGGWEGGCGEGWMSTNGLDKPLRFPGHPGSCARPPHQWWSLHRWEDGKEGVGKGHRSGT